MLKQTLLINKIEKWNAPAAGKTAVRQQLAAANFSNENYVNTETTKRFDDDSRDVEVLIVLEKMLCCYLVLY